MKNKGLCLYVMNAISLTQNAVLKELMLNFGATVKILFRHSGFGARTKLEMLHMKQILLQTCSA